jgi:hypothetical protein
MNSQCGPKTIGAAAAYKLMVFKLVNAPAKTWRRLKGERPLDARERGNTPEHPKVRINSVAIEVFDEVRGGATRVYGEHSSTGARTMRPMAIIFIVVVALIADHYWYYGHYTRALIGSVERGAKSAIHWVDRNRPRP